MGGVTSAPITAFIGETLLRWKDGELLRAPWSNGCGSSQNSGRSGNVETATRKIRNGSFPCHSTASLLHGEWRDDEQCENCSFFFSRPFVSFSTCVRPSVLEDFGSLRAAHQLKLTTPVLAAVSKSKLKTTCTLNDFSLVWEFTSHLKCSGASFYNQTAIDRLFRYHKTLFGNGVTPSFQLLKGNKYTYWWKWKLQKKSYINTNSCARLPGWADVHVVL